MSADQDTRYYRFGPVSGPIAVRGGEDIIVALIERLKGWAVAPWTGAMPPPAIELDLRGPKFILRATLIEAEERYGDTISIARAFIAELIMAYGADRPDEVMLHAGAVALNGRLIVFPAKAKTGKSTLTAQLARAGGRVFSDDVLPVDLKTGVVHALGIEPHVRLPLPASLSAGARTWIEAHASLRGPKGAYIDLAKGDLLAPLGETGRVDAMVLLNRDPSAAAGLTTCSRSDVMAQLIFQYFGKTLSMTELLPAFKTLIENVPCYRLNYGGGDQAAELLLDMGKAA